MTYDKWKTRSPDDERADGYELDLNAAHRKNLRKCMLERDFLAIASHQDITDRLRVAGFKFDHIDCPVKLTRPWATAENEDGTVTWTQWEDQE